MTILYCLFLMYVGIAILVYNSLPVKARHSLAIGVVVSRAIHIVMKNGKTVSFEVADFRWTYRDGALSWRAITTSPMDTVKLEGVNCAEVSHVSVGRLVLRFGFGHRETDLG